MLDRTKYNIRRLGPLPPADDALAPRPVIHVSPGSYVQTGDEAEAAIREAELDVYQRGVSLMRPAIQDTVGACDRPTKTASLIPVSISKMRDYMGRAAGFTEPDKKGKP